MSRTIWIVVPLAVLGSALAAFAVITAYAPEANLADPAALSALALGALEDDLAETRVALDSVTSELASLRLRLDARARAASVDDDADPAFAARPADRQEAVTQADIEAAIARLLAQPEGAFREAVQASLEEIERERAEQRAAARRARDRERMLASVNGDIERYREALGLTDDQVAQIQALADGIIDQELDAQAAGADATARAELDRQAQWGVRQILSESQYRGYRSGELQRRGRPIIGYIANTAGLDEAQRQNLDRFAEEHIERVVDTDIRIASEAMSDEDRQKLRDEMNAANQEAWQYIRGQILTEEQRERIPETPGR